MKLPVNQMFSIPNNEEGRLFLALANKYLNSESYCLWARGRTPDHKKIKKEKANPGWFRQSIPLKYSLNMGIYLMAKVDGGKRKQVLGIRDAITVNQLRAELWQNRSDKASKSEASWHLEKALQILTSEVRS